MATVWKFLYTQRLFVGTFLLKKGHKYNWSDKTNEKSDTQQDTRLKFILLVPSYIVTIVVFFIHNTNNFVHILPQQKGMKTETKKT